MTEPTRDELKAEAKFMREALLNIAQMNTRYKRAKRFAQSALTFWEEMQNWKRANQQEGI